LNVKSVFNTIRLFVSLLLSLSLSPPIFGKIEETSRIERLIVDSFAPMLQKNATIEDPSRVIITASVAGIGIGSLGKNATFGYSASKAAVIHLAKNLAVELGPRHILTNAIAPGFFPSKMANDLSILPPAFSHQRFMLL
jgi:NAD(P)-dependent dehydrogenase (short-subunit alcohol dehydrogenase family)